MRKIKLAPHYTIQELNQILDKQDNIREYKEWQIIFAVANNDTTAEEISKFIGASKRKIYDSIMKYNKLGRQ